MLLLLLLMSADTTSTLGARNFGISLKCGLAFNFYFNIALKFERFPQVCKGHGEMELGN